MSTRARSARNPTIQDPASSDARIAGTISAVLLWEADHPGFENDPSNPAVTMGGSPLTYQTGWWAIRPPASVMLAGPSIIPRS